MPARKDHIELIEITVHRLQARQIAKKLQLSNEESEAHRAYVSSKKIILTDQENAWCLRPLLNEQGRIDGFKMKAIGADSDQKQLNFRNIDQNPELLETMTYAGAFTHERISTIYLVDSLLLIAECWL